MFCPRCGRDNVAGTKFCVSCGTNLEVVSQALTGSKENFFTKLDAGFDLLMARYSERIFKNAQRQASERTAAASWKLLGKGVVISFVDLFLFFLMWNILPLRFFLLLISTPIRMLSQRRGHGELIEGTERDKNRLLVDSIPEKWSVASVVSVSEHTTELLDEIGKPKTTAERDAE